MTDAADKLAKTRLAIVNHIHRRDRRDDRDDHDVADREEDGEPARAQFNEGKRRGPAAWFSHIQRVGGAWWRSHPASMGLELATPILSKYARQKPAQFLAIAAVVGAVVVVARPWRLISATGLLVALLKSSQLSGLVMSAMSAADYPKDPPPRR